MHAKSKSMIGGTNDFEPRLRTMASVSHSRKSRSTVSATWNGISRGLAVISYALVDTLPPHLFVGDTVKIWKAL